MKSKGAIIKLSVAALLVIGGFVAMRFMPLADWLKLFETQTAHLGLWGPLLYIAIFGVGVAMLGPFSMFAVGSGFCFGVWAGGSVAWAGGMLGSIFAFFLSRGILRSSVAELVASRPFFRKLDAVLGGKNGGYLIFLLRLSPAIPYSLSNYVYGATSIGFIPYVLASALGDLPIGFVYAYLGVAGREGANLVAGTGQAAKSPLEWAVLGLGLLATVALSVLLTRFAKTALAKEGLEAPQNGPAQAIH